MEQKVEGDVNGKIPNAFLNLPTPRSLSQFTESCHGSRTLILITIVGPGLFFRADYRDKFTPNTPQTTDNLKG